MKEWTVRTIAVVIVLLLIGIIRLLSQESPEERP